MSTAAEATIETKHLQTCLGVGRSDGRYSIPKGDPCYRCSRSWRHRLALETSLHLTVFPSAINHAEKLWNGSALLAAPTGNRKLGVTRERVQKVLQLHFIEASRRHVAKGIEGLSPCGNFLVQQ